MNESASLEKAIPVLLTGDLPQSVAFFERLGFKARHNDGAYAILERDQVELHFSNYPASTRKLTRPSAG